MKLVPLWKLLLYERKMNIVEMMKVNTNGLFRLCGRCVTTKYMNTGTSNRIYFFKFVWGQTWETTSADVASYGPEMSRLQGAGGSMLVRRHRKPVLTSRHILHTFSDLIIPV